VKIVRDNLWAVVAEKTEDEERWLRDYLTFSDESAFFEGRSTEQCLYNVIHEKFPSGFVNKKMLKAAREDGVEVHVEDMRMRPAVEPDLSVDLAWLYDFQREAVVRVAKHGRGIIRSPTGSGKTEMAAAVMKAIRVRWLFLVNGKDLMANAVRRFRARLGEPIGQAGDGVWDVEHRVVVATFRTVASKLQQRKSGPGGEPPPREAALALLASVDGIGVDEVHELPAGVAYSVAMKTTNAFYRVGYSGTPLDRGDRRSVMSIGAIGPVIYRVWPRTLYEKGIISWPDIVMVDCEQTSTRPRWNGVYTECITKSRRRNGVIAQIVNRAKKPCLVFVAQVKHGQVLLDLLRKRGENVDFVFGDDSLEARDQAIERLERGDLEVLICSTIFNQGVDIPYLRSVVVAAANKSLIMALQRIGRGMRRLDKSGRPIEGKETFEVWDIHDRGHKFLDRWTRYRMRAYKREGYDPSFEGDTLPLPLFAGR